MTGQRNTISFEEGLGNIMIVEEMTYQFRCRHCDEIGNVHTNRQLAQLEGEKHIKGTHRA